MDGFSVRGRFLCSGPGSAGARGASDFSVSGRDGAGARWRTPADRDSDSHERDEAAADFIPADALWRAGESATADALVNEGVGAGWIYFRGAEPARAIQVGRRLQAVVPGRPERSESHERNHRCL